MFLTIRLIINNLKVKTSKALLFSMFATFTVVHSNAYAQTSNTDVLLPIINFLLADDAVQCPSVTEETTLFSGVNFSSDVGIFTVGPANTFDPTDLSEFLSGVLTTDPNSGTTGAEQLAMILSSGQGDINVEEAVTRILSQDDVNALAGITRIVGSLSLNTEFSVQDELDLSPLNTLVEVTGDVFFRTNNANINGFKCLASIGGDLNIQGNDNLTSVDAFQSLALVGASLIVLSNDSLNNVDGFPLLASIGSDLLLGFNESLESVSGFALLRAVAGELNVTSNESLDSISVFQSLVSVGSLRVSNNAALEGLDGFSLLESVGQDLTISFNEYLQSIGGLELLASIGNDLNISNNASLERVGTFSQLEVIGRDLNIINNESLDDLGALTILGRESVVDDIIIAFNPSFDCSNPTPLFSPVTVSLDNAVDCDQDLLRSRFSVSNSEFISISDLESVTSTIQIQDQSGITGVVRSLQVGLDITHSSVGDLTVTLSNGTTTVNLIERPTGLTNDDGLLAAIASGCVDSFPDDGFLSEVSGRPLVSQATGDVFDQFVSINTNCFATLNTTNDEDLATKIANECLDSSTGDSFLESEIEDELFDTFSSIDLDCAVALLSASNDDDLTAKLVERGCLGSLPFDDSFEEEVGGEIFGSFPSLDAACVLAVLNEINGDNSEFCNSNDILVNLSDNASLLPINTSCSVVDSDDAYSESSYSSLELLSAFEGSDINSTWTLTVTDSEGENVGVLNSWTILFDIDRN